MKQMFLIVQMMMLFTITFAGTPELDCRDAYTNSPDLNQKASVAKDLIESNWLVSHYTGKAEDSRIIFHDFGAVDQIISKEDGTYSFSRSQWTLEEYNNALFLVISHLDGDQQTNMYRVSQTCNGMDLTDIGSLQRLSFIHQGKKQEQKIALMSQEMTGEWISVGYAFDRAEAMDDCGTFQPMNGAFLQFSFRGDGTYARSLGNSGIALRESGFWDITDDGKFLLLHILDLHGNRIERTDVAEIDYLENGSFTLTQALVNREKNDMFCTELKEIGFRRWTPGK